jgi:hypothetical protein
MPTMQTPRVGAATSCSHGGASTGSASYGWPVKPFRVQHPVRGYFGDPRIGDTGHGISTTFHFGVDVSAPDGTPVYATVSGRIAFHPVHPDVVRILAGDGLEFSYWHVVPAVQTGEYAIAYRTVIGRIENGWGHVHFSEQRSGVFLNPLRPGAMGPYADGTCPRIKAVRFARNGYRLAGSAVNGNVDILVRALDEPAISAPPPWADMPVMPSLVQWRITKQNGRPVTAWRLAFDVTETLPSLTYDRVYASGTRQNHPNRPGKYLCYLARGWDTAELPNGAYAVQVAVADTRGNRVRSSWSLVVAN